MRKIAITGKRRKARTAFMPFYELDGKPMYQHADDTLIGELPRLLLPSPEVNCAE